MQEPEKVDARAAEAVGALAWIIAAEFERAFDELFIEMATLTAEELELAKPPKVKHAGRR